MKVGAPLAGARLYGGKLGVRKGRPYFRLHDSGSGWGQRPIESAGLQRRKAARPTDWNFEGNWICCTMRFAADLHLHSRYARAVSPAMTVENIAHWAQRKGIDLLGTGDCLQADWLGEIEVAMTGAEAGLFTLKPEAAEKTGRTLPEGVRRQLRFVLSVEVCCAPPGTPELGGIHHLIYFPSFDSVRRFRERIARHGDLREGRPTLELDSRQLLESVLAHDETCHVAPAHIFNPWYSALGTVSGKRSMDELFGEFASRLLAVETGLTSTPPMCRRVSDLDRYTLFSCSDAHSPWNIGRECTRLEMEPGYAALFDALRRGSVQEIPGTLKFPIERTRYYRNRCGVCRESFDGKSCPHCGRALVMGSRDRLEIVADRSEAVGPAEAPPFQQLLPLAYVIAGLLRINRDNPAVGRLEARLISALGHERFILTEATYDEIAQASTPQLARIIAEQRIVPPGPLPEKKTKSDPDPRQLPLNL